MSAPVTNLEVLRLEYAVVGGEWLIGDPDYQEPKDDDDEPGNPTLCLRGHDWQIWEGEDGWTEMDGAPPYEAFVAWGCAQLGVPTPWRAAELLETEAKECDKVVADVPPTLRACLLAACVSTKSAELIEHQAMGTVFYRATRMLRGGKL